MKKPTTTTTLMEILRNKKQQQQPTTRRQTTSNQTTTKPNNNKSQKQAKNMKKPITGMTGQPATDIRVFLAKKKIEIEAGAAAIPAITPTPVSDSIIHPSIEVTSARSEPENKTGGRNTKPYRMTQQQGEETERTNTIGYKKHTQWNVTNH